MNSILDELIDSVRTVFDTDSVVTRIFQNSLSDTLQKTVRTLKDGSYFIITGDIPAMWLRDSSCQLHFFVRYASKDSDVQRIVRGIIAKQIECILIDPYANAFNSESSGACYAHDDTHMKPEIWERKFEVDSLCYPIQLSYLYYRQTGDISIFSDTWKSALLAIVNTFYTELDHENLSKYRFQRYGTYFSETLSRAGRGSLTKNNIGLIWSGFRPSDDACVYGYNVPSNMFAAVILEYASEILSEIYQDKENAARVHSFSQSIRKAIETYAILPGLKSPAYAYEVDGYGQYLIMDDANVPSLLAMPYFGYCSADDAVYQQTKALVLSEANPYYYTGKFLKGIGSPHTKPQRVWPIALAMQGLTTSDKNEKLSMIQMIANSDAGTGFVHESVDVNDPNCYSRPWFSWANMMFCELVMDYCSRN